MKTKRFFSRMLITLLFTIITASSWAINQNLTQTVCPGSELYSVTPGNPANTFLWTISTGTSGVNWTISTPTLLSTNVVWANPVAPVTYALTLTETDAVTFCKTVVTVNVTVNPLPAAPTSGGNIVQCKQSPLQTLTATATAPAGATVVWYTALTGGTVVASPTLNAVGTVTYYAESVSTIGGCVSSSRTPVTLAIEDAPAAPTSGGNITQCEQSPIQTITATATTSVGSTVVWYDALTGGSVVATPTRNTVGTVTYYAESVVTAGGCTSLTRTPVVLTINPAPVAPVSGGNIVECEQLPIQTITATATAPAGSTVVWYTALTGGTVVASPTRNTVGSVTYYAESVVTLTVCSSLTRTAVTLTINPAPAAPISGGNITDCKQSPIQTLTTTATSAAGSTVVWYTALSGGTVVSTPTLKTVGTVTYYAESVVTLTGCISLSRTAVVLTINDTPATSPIFHN